MWDFDWPPQSPTEVISRLREDDVLTHCFGRFPAAPVRPDGRIIIEFKMREKEV